MGPGRLASELKIPLDLAKTYYYGHKKEFAVMHKFLEATGKFAGANLYVETVLGRKRFFKAMRFPEVVRVMASSLNNNRAKMFHYAMSKAPSYLDYIRQCKQIRQQPQPFMVWQKTLPEEWQTFLSSAAAIAREGGNHPVQGGNADITKHAMVMIRNRLKAAGLYPTARICLQVYDELVGDCREGDVEQMDDIMQRSMIEAGELVIRSVPVELDTHIEDHWTK